MNRRGAGSEPPSEPDDRGQWDVPPLGSKVRITEGPFENSVGTVAGTDATKGTVQGDDARFGRAVDHG